MSESLPLLFVSGLRDAPLLQGLSLRVEDGELVCLKGDEFQALHRAARLMAGRGRPSGGDVYLDSRKITDNWPDNRQLYFIAGGKKPLFYRKKWEESLIGLGLAPETLGEGSRVFASRLLHALFERPRLLIADASGLDLSCDLKSALLERLKAAALEGMGALWLEDTPGLDEDFDRVYLMSGGRVIQSGSPQELYEHPRSARAARMGGECFCIPGRIEALKGNRLLLSASGLNIPCRSELWLAPGEKVCLFLRPEWLSWRREKTPKFSPPLVARLAESNRQGGRWALRFELAQGLSLEFERSDVEESLRVAGENYHLWWEMERALLLAPEDEETA